MTFPSQAIGEPPIISVGELTRRAKQLLEWNFPLQWIAGEISNFTRAASGHWYFTLKDERAQVRCAMFRNKNQYLDWIPENGMQVEVRALVTLYEPRGDFQLGVENLRRAGLGALYEAFEKLKQRLGDEGLFDEVRKKPLPAYPQRIGIVTSPAAAALRDVLTTLRRRMPGMEVLIYPTPVQGDGAAAKIAEALRNAARRDECELLIVCRGGGSIEDLWAFNEEVVARAIAASTIPIISGVGHETDFTIADFVADRRAPTPTAAAEIASPERRELAQRLAAIANRLSRVTERSLEQHMQQLDYLARRLIPPSERLKLRAAHLTHLRQRLTQSAAHSLANRAAQLGQAQHRLALALARPDTSTRQATLDNLSGRLQRAAGHTLATRQTHLDHLAAQLQHLNPQAVLERGFSMVRNQHGEIIRNSAMLSSDQQISLTFAQGSATARVEEVEGKC